MPKYIGTEVGVALRRVYKESHSNDLEKAEILIVREMKKKMKQAFEAGVKYNELVYSEGGANSKYTFEYWFKENYKY